MQNNHAVQLHEFTRRMNHRRRNAKRRRPVIISSCDAGARFFRRLLPQISSPFLSPRVISSGVYRSLTTLINIHYRHGAPDASRRLQAARASLPGLAETLSIAILRDRGHEEVSRHERKIDDDRRPPCHRSLRTSNVLLLTRTGESPARTLAIRKDTAASRGNDSKIKRVIVIRVIK